MRALSWYLGCLLLVVALAAEAGPQFAPARQKAIDAWRQRALKEVLQPVRPGQPGKQAFWNGHARRFIYAPTFDFPAVKGAAAYRFELQAKGKTYTFTAEVPWASLAPVWNELPVAQVTLTVRPLDQSGKPFGKALSPRTFYKDAPFAGFYRDPPETYGASARECLQAIFAKDYVRAWLALKAPDLHYGLYRYPSKMISALLQGAVAYSKLSPRPKDADDALQIAFYAGRWLIKHSEGPASPLAGFPPTYYGLAKGVGHMKDTHLMMHYPALAAWGYLDYYEATGDERFQQAALQIAETYRKLQLPSGTWYLFVDTTTGKPLSPNLLVPVQVMRLFARLVDRYGLEEYKLPLVRAEEWMQANPERTFNWQGQFEDVKPAPPYEDLTMINAADYASWLLARPDCSPKALQQGLELLRFVEDQFIFWSPGAWTPDFWFFPGVGEQYRCYTPVVTSSSFAADAFCYAYQRTHDLYYLAKARELVNTILVAQKYTGGGEYPTWLNRQGGTNWLNCSVSAALTVLQWQHELTLPAAPEALESK